MFFFGPAGAGKSTLAREWCNTRQRAVQIQLDEVRSMIVSGLADPQSGSPAVSEQYETAAKACCSLARTFLADGYDVTIDDAESPTGFESHWKPYLEDFAWTVVVIRPDLQTTLDRNNRREKEVRREIIEEQHRVAGSWPEIVQVDTTDLTIEESLGKVAELLDSTA